MKTEMPNQTEKTQYTSEELRTSYNNMLCTVTYEPLPQEQQEEVEQILQVAL